jgi:hypothetical protein
VASPGAVALEITIFNPTLDPEEVTAAPAG